MANKKKRISWKTEFLNLKSAYQELSKKQDKVSSLHQETLSKLDQVESKLESKEKINNALKSQNDHFRTVLERDAKTKDEIRDIIYNRKYNTLFGGVSNLKADILKTL
jgi:chromosome segregation ATPase